MAIESRPNYKAIFSDIIEKKCPEKRKECIEILRKEKLTSLDIIRLNNIIFDITIKESEDLNQKHRSYNDSDMAYILEYQRKNNLNNIQLASHFKMSRNTISKWKKLSSDKKNKF